MSLDLGTGYNPTPQEVLNKVLNTTGTSPAFNVALTADAITISATNSSPDAGLFRVSSIGGTAGDRTLVDGTTQTISATLTPISASPANTTAGLVTNSFQFDSGKHLVSAKQGDAGLLRVSALNLGGNVATNQIVIASAAATQIIAPNTGRLVGVTVVNGSTQDIYLGSSAVTTGNGVLLLGTKGTSMTIPTTSALYGIVSATGQTVSYLEI